MIKKMTCTNCGLDFEVADFLFKDRIFCPRCATVADLNAGKKLERLGEFRIVELIGQGGMGQVYRATAPDGSVVALKLLAQDSASSPELRERFDREMSIMEVLKHPNIVSIISRGTTSLFMFFAMELVEGTNLRRLIKDESLNKEKIASFSLQILDALGCAHSKGIIHRDIKPENILISTGAIVKVTDFGLARKSWIGSNSGRGLTRTNAFMGTENYMSPEQKINPKAVTHKSDLYSLGVVIYEMLTGGLMPMGIFQPPSYYAGIDEAWDDLVFRLLDLNPDMRPDNCDMVAEMIRGIQAGNRPEEALVAPDEKGRSSENTIADPFAEREEERYRRSINELMQKAVSEYDEGRFEDSLQTWRRLFMMVTEIPDRDLIKNWMNDCELRLAEAAREEGSICICPSCGKPFHYAQNLERSEKFNCPVCSVPIWYDKVYCCLKVASPTEAGDGEIPQPSPPRIEKVKDKAARTKIQLVSLLLLILYATDWLIPDHIESAVAFVHNHTIDGVIDLSSDMLCLWLRFILQCLVLLVCLKYFYSFCEFRL